MIKLPPKKWLHYNPLDNPEAPYSAHALCTDRTWPGEFECVMAKFKKEYGSFMRGKEPRLYIPEDTEDETVCIIFPMYDVLALDYYDRDVALALFGTTRISETSENGNTVEGEIYSESIIPSREDIPEEQGYYYGTFKGEIATFDMYVEDKKHPYYDPKDPKGYFTIDSENHPYESPITDEVYFNFLKRKGVKEHEQFHKSYLIPLLDCKRKVFIEIHYDTDWNPKNPDEVVGDTSLCKITSINNNEDKLLRTILDREEYWEFQRNTTPETRAILDEITNKINELNEELILNKELSVKK